MTKRMLEGRFGGLIPPPQGEWGLQLASITFDRGALSKFPHPPRQEITFTSFDGGMVHLESCDRESGIGLILMFSRAGAAELHKFLTTHLLRTEGQ